MYLFHQPLDATRTATRTSPRPASDEADIVYHEYTHGLSHRLVVDANDVPALDSQQGASMGEAWSDWYAADYLVDQGLQADTRAPGEIEVGATCSPAVNTIRTRTNRLPGRQRRRALPGHGRRPDRAATPTATSARSRAAASRCTPTARSGRRRCGTCGPPSARSAASRSSPAAWSSRRPTRRSSTCATRSSRPMSSIDTARTSRCCGRSSRTAAWASSPARSPAATSTPVEDFSMPPTRTRRPPRSTAPCVDSESGARVPGAIVAFGGHDSGFPGSYAAETDSAGQLSRSPTSSTAAIPMSTPAGPDSTRRSGRWTSTSPTTSVDLRAGP